MRVERLTRPLSIDAIRDGGAYFIPPGAPRRTNVFFDVHLVDALYIKCPTREGRDEYRRSVRRAEATAVDVRPLDNAERFESLSTVAARFPELANLAGADAELLHYLVVHKLQYERLRATDLIDVPPARFGATRRSWLFRSLAPALFQARVPGTTLWDMFDFEALRIRTEWRSCLPSIAARLQHLVDSPLVDHIDWNIQNFVYDKTADRLFYVDMKPTTFVASHSNAHNLAGIRRYFLA